MFLSRSVRRTRSPGSNATCGVEFDKWEMPTVDVRRCPIDQSEGFLRRRRRVWAGECDHGGRSRAPGGRLDRRSCNGKDVNVRPSPMVNLHPEDGHPRMGVRQRDRRIRTGAASREGRDSRDIKQEVELGFDVVGVTKKPNAASTAMCRPFSPPSSASSAMRASISVRRPASRLPPTAKKPTCARARRCRHSISRRTSTSTTASRPAASWSRTKTSASTAASAPNAAPPPPGTCRNI